MLCFQRLLQYYNIRGGSRIFFRRGCTRLLLYFNTNKPHSFFFCRIPVVLENRRSSLGGAAHPLYPPPRSGHEYSNLFTFSGTNSYWIWRYSLHIGFRLRMFSQPVPRSHEKIGDCKQSTTHAADTTKSLIKSLHLILIFFPLYFTWNDRLILHP